MKSQHLLGKERERDSSRNPGQKKGEHTDTPFCESHNSGLTCGAVAGEDEGYMKVRFIIGGIVSPL